MAETTLTINHADGGSETYTINRDKFAGVRAMQIDGNSVEVDHTAVAKPAAKETTYVVKGDTPVATQETVHLYGISGQSNGVGRAGVTNVGTRYDNLQDAFIYDSSAGNFAVLDLGVTNKLSGGYHNTPEAGPEMELMKLASESTDNKVFLVKYAVGGSNLLDEWDSEAGSNYYNTFVNDYNAAVAYLHSQGYNIVHKGILFAQGEADTRPLAQEASEYYETKQAALINNFRNDTGLPELPFALTLITIDPSQHFSYPDFATVNTAKLNVEASVPHVTTIDTSAYTFEADGVHYDLASQILHGTSFYGIATGVEASRLMTITREIEPLLKEVVGGARAAFSLQDLTGDDLKVVNVRRGADNADKDFKASEITSGALIDWVTEAGATEIYASDFSSGVDNWTDNTNNLNLTGNIDGIGGLDDVLKIENISGSARQVRPSNNIAHAGGTTYRLLLDVYRVGGTGVPSFVGLYTDTSVKTNVPCQTSLVDDQWVTLDFGSVEMASGWTRFNLYFSNSAASNTAAQFPDGATLYFRNARVEEDASTGFVTTWHDQSGHNNHASQPSSGLQPQLVENGALLTDGGEPCLRFNSVRGDHLQYTYDVANPVEGSICAVFNNTAGAAANIFSIRSESTSLFNLLSQSDQETRLQFRDSDNSLITVIANAGATIGRQLTCIHLNKAAPNYVVHVNDDEATGANTTSALSGTFTSDTVTIGASDNGSVITKLTGNIQEIIYYDSDEVTNRSALETNINNRYTGLTTG